MVEDEIGTGAVGEGLADVAELYPAMVLFFVFPAVGEPVHFCKGEGVAGDTEFFLLYVVAIDVDTVDVGTSRHDEMVFLLDGGGDENVAVAIA